MEQRDLIEKQIEKIGLILNKILSKILKGNNTESASQLEEEVNTSLDTIFNFNSDDFKKIQPDEIIYFLQYKKNVNPAHWEKIANILFLMIEKSKTNNDIYTNTLNNCLTIYNFLEKSEGIFSLERNQKINKIKNILNNKN
jgi:hypothetical protein